MQANHHDLSEREQEILCLVATGASNKEIARQLYISPNTVKVHLRNIFNKIGVNSRTEAAIYAVNAGLVPGVTQAGEQGAAGEQTEHPFPAGLTSLLGLNGAALGLLALLSVIIIGFGVYFWRLSLGDTATGEAAPEDLRWQTLAPMETARSGFAAVVYENQIYVIAGKTGQGVANVVEKYDPSTNTWSTLSPKPTAVRDVKGSVIGGRIYVPGGCISSEAITADLEIYDPRQDVWTRGASLPVAVCAYALTSFEGKLYLFGGWDGEQYLNSVYTYDPEKDEWDQGTPMGLARGYMEAVEVSGKIYVLGGYDGEKALTANDRYSPEEESGQQNPWQKRAPLPQGRAAMGATNALGVIYVVGGEGDLDDRLPFLEYHPSTNAWRESEGTLNQPWSRLGLVSLGQYFYIIGGELDGTPTAQNLGYQAFYNIMLPIVR